MCPVIQKDGTSGAYYQEPGRQGLMYLNHTTCLSIRTEYERAGKNPEYVATLRRYGYKVRNPKRVRLYNGETAYQGQCNMLTGGAYAGKFALTSESITAYTLDGHETVLRSEAQICDYQGSYYVNTVPMEEHPTYGLMCSHIIEDWEPCSQCGVRHPHMMEDDDEYVCQDCDPDLYLDDDGLTSYNDHSSVLSFPREDTSDFSMGIELECETRDIRRDTLRRVRKIMPKEYCIYKRDGSLDDEYGVEIVTRPDSLRVHTRIWSNALTELAGHLRGWYGSCCGMHVHVDRASIGEDTVARLCVLLGESKRFTSTMAGRLENEYTRIYKKTLDDYKSMGRYEAVNTSNHDTVEVRIFRSNLSVPGFLKNIQFVHAAVNYCKSITGEPTIAGFIGWLMQNPTDYPELMAFMVDRGLMVVSEPSPVPGSAFQHDGTDSPDFRDRVNPLDHGEGQEESYEDEDEDEGDDEGDDEDDVFFASIAVGGSN